MYIIKPTPEMKRHVPLLLMGGMMCCLSAVTYAHEEHNHMTDEQPVMQMDASSAMRHEQHQIVPVRLKVESPKKKNSFRLVSGVGCPVRWPDICIFN